jgi:hypothetical protein
VELPWKLLWGSNPSPPLQEKIMNLWETEKELIALKKENKELKEKLRAILYQVEFHADEYSDISMEYDMPVLKGVIARFKGLANDLKALARKYPQIEKAG